MEKPILFTFRFAHFTFLYPNVLTVDPEKNAGGVDIMLNKDRDKIILDGAMGDDVIKKLIRQAEDSIAIHIKTYTKKPEIIIYDPREPKIVGYKTIEHLNELERLLTPRDQKK